jgi:hypothetical protein
MSTNRSGGAAVHAGRDFRHGRLQIRSAAGGPTRARDTWSRRLAGHRRSRTDIRACGRHNARRSADAAALWNSSRRRLGRARRNRRLARRNGQRRSRGIRGGRTRDQRESSAGQIRGVDYGDGNANSRRSHDTRVGHSHRRRGWTSGLCVALHVGDSPARLTSLSEVGTRLPSVGRARRGAARRGPSIRSCVRQAPARANALLRA